MKMSEYAIKHRKSRCKITETIRMSPTVKRHNTQNWTLQEKLTYRKSKSTLDLHKSSRSLRRMNHTRQVSLRITVSSCYVTNRLIRCDGPHWFQSYGNSISTTVYMLCVCNCKRVRKTIYMSNLLQTIEPIYNCINS